MLDASQTELTLEATQNIRVGIEETKRGRDPFLRL